MAITVSGTTITFNDGSTQTTAATSANPAPLNSQIGGMVVGYLITSSPSSSTIIVNYAAEATASGSSIAYDMYYRQTSTYYYYVALGVGVFKGSPSGGTSFPANNGGVPNNYGYSTLSGSWRSISAFSISNINAGCCAYTAGWGSALWRRYA